MSEFIYVPTDLKESMSVFSLSRSLNITNNEAIGVILSFLSWCKEQEYDPENLTEDLEKALPKICDIDFPGEDLYAILQETGIIDLAKVSVN